MLRNLESLPLFYYNIIEVSPSFVSANFTYKKQRYAVRKFRNISYNFFTMQTVYLRPFTYSPENKRH